MSGEAMRPWYRTPYDKSGSEGVGAEAQLRICCGDLTPMDVSNRLGLSSTEATIRGEPPIPDPLGRAHPAPLNTWFLTASVQSREMRDHLDWLLVRLRGAEPALLELQDVEGVTMHVVCAYQQTGQTGAFTLWPGQMEALARLRLECRFEISVFM